MPATLEIRKAAVLGAGVMGAQIAAHLTNAGIATLLFDLPAEGKPKGAIAQAAIARLSKISPHPLAEPGLAAALIPMDYEHDIEALAECDLVIEAIAERLDLKRSLYQRIAAHLNERAVLASNTSGLSIAAMAAILPKELRARFCGLHFFNPPRYMPLVELIPCAENEPELLDRLEAFLVTTLGKSVVRAKDTPNFIGNRIGVFSMLATVHHSQRLGLGFDEVDALTGTVLGRPKSATYRTLDVVGLDTLAHVIATLHEHLPEDPWHRYFAIPAWGERLIEQGALGQKSGAGCYRKRAGKIEVLDPTTFEYRPAEAAAAPEVAALLAIKDPGERLAALRASPHPHAQLLWASLRDLFHYCAVQLEDIAAHAFDLDLALRWGYGWKQGPFETWQAAGWRRVAGWLEEEIAQAKTMSDAPLPAWVTEIDGVYQAGTGFAPASGRFEPRGRLPVYARQRVLEPLLEDPSVPGETLFENSGLRAWHDGDGVLVASFTTKGHVVTSDVLVGVREVVAIAERDFDALVLWHPEAPFSYGADLKGAMALLDSGEREAFALLVADFQRTSQRLKYALVPVVAAIQGMALGGGCELQMHSARTVAALESYVGLVEAGVGLLPAGGGLKEFALRASRAQGERGDLLSALAPRFETIAMARVAGSAREAQAAGLLRGADVTVMNPRELLHVARHQARALFEAGYRAPLPAGAIRVAGRPGIANFDAQIINLLEGGMISEHDADIAHRIAVVLCGGEVDADERVDEAWLLGLEREHFVQLAMSAKTQERIRHTLKTGKPLRN